MNTSGSTKEQLLRDLNYLYWSAYHAGHHDTVEGRYTDVVAVDRHDYHADAVQDCINSGDMETVRLAPEPAADVAALNRELCGKEGHVLGVIARPCLRCHAWFDPQYGKNMNLADRHDLSLFALTVLTNLTGATPATHPDTFKVAQQYADAWLARQPETKEAK